MLKLDDLTSRQHAEAGSEADVFVRTGGEGGREGWREEGGREGGFLRMFFSDDHALREF